MMISENCILDNNLNIDSIFNNRTYLYLSPVLLKHGDYFKQRVLADTHRIAYGILDTALLGSPLIESNNKRPIFLLLSTLIKPTRLDSFLNFIRTEHYYITDYIFDTFNTYPSQRMVVLDIPKEYYKTYDEFKLGNYSSMFTEEQIKDLFESRQVDKDVIKVLTKDPNYKKTFTQIVEKRFGVEVSTNQIKELDFPYTLDKSAEIFGYKYLL